MNTLELFVNESGNLVDGINTLETEYNIKVKTEDNFVNLCYDQIKSPKTAELTRLCRGSVLINRGGYYEQVFLPMDRFFNLGESPELVEDVDIGNCVAYEKVDGSMIKIYCVDGHWYCGTKGTPKGTAQVANGNTFISLVYKALPFVNTGRSFNDFCNTFLNPKISYTFEITCPDNRVVKRYEGYTLWFLCARNTKTGEYFSPEQVNNVITGFEATGIKLPKAYYFDTVEHCVETANNLKDLDEGYVLYHNNVPRIKVKSPAYLAVHHLRGEGVLSKKRVLHLLFLNEQDEYLSYFPEDKQFFYEMRDHIIELNNDLARAKKLFFGIENIKEFAMSVKHYTYSSVLFTAKRGNRCPLEVFRNLELDQKTKLIMKYMDKPEGDLY